MCGITGIIGIKDENTLIKMNNALIHRGPDEEGYYFDENISLGNRRLSIIDLSTGTQPIYNEDKSLVVVYNGEIYNYQEIRKSLIDKGHKFNTNCDTEIIVHAFEEYGVDCLQHFNGDFAFILYNLKDMSTFIARDRMGIRPLYYSVIDNKVYIASELKALLASEKINKELNYGSIDKYLTLRYCWGNETFFNNIKKLPPAHFMLIKDGNISISKYWEVDYTPLNYKNLSDYVDQFDQIFEESVKLRMIADVPFGAFLSGGIDSSIIVALMAKHSTLPVETYSLGFNLDIDETNDARELANYFGCNHHEISITQQSYDLLPEIISHFSEPLGDSIIIPTYQLAKEAAKNLKVVLTGEGADELFGSYVHQQVMHYGSYYNKIIPASLNNHAFLPMAKIAPMQLLDRLFPYPSSLGKKGKEKLVSYLGNIHNLTDSYFSIAQIFSPQDKEMFYHSNLKNKLTNFDVKSEFSLNIAKNNNLDTLNNLIDLDCKYWLSDYTLYKQDRITMANSLEGRIPFLDHNLVEFVARIPIKYKTNGLTTKYLLRKMARSYIPKQVAKRKKKAFFFPYQKTFGKDFNSYLNDLFNENSFIINMDLINKKQLDNLHKNALNNELLQSKQLMSLVILENWLRIYT